jgi:signal transduction histidine kinase
MHPLLRRQLRKAFGETLPESPELARFLASIDEAYAATDDDRLQLERSLFLASEELYERNRRLEDELEERKRLEVELRQAEKLRVVGQLAAGVAHEVNTPIQFVGDSVDFLSQAFADLDACVPATEQAESLAFVRGRIPRALERCRDGLARVSTIVRALNTFARPDGYEQERADLGEAIETTLLVVANEIKNVADTRVELASTRMPRCNAGEIRQVLLNLVVNAGHAIADRVGTSGQRGTICVNTRDDGADIVLTISDDGAGIPATIRDRIFEPFFTTKPVGMGSGQGLALVHSLIVDRHGGQVAFESTVGRGTTFTIRIPVDGAQS